MKIKYGHKYNHPKYGLVKACHRSHGKRVVMKLEGREFSWKDMVSVDESELEEDLNDG